MQHNTDASSPATPSEKRCPKELWKKQKKVIGFGWIMAKASNDQRVRCAPDVPSRVTAGILREVRVLSRK